MKIKFFKEKNFDFLFVIIVLFLSIRTAQDCSRYKPPIPIIAVTRDQQVARQLHLYRGVFPLLYTEKPEHDWAQDLESRIEDAIGVGKTRGFIHNGDIVAIITGWRTGLCLLFRNK